MDINEANSKDYEDHYSNFKIPEIYHDKNFIMKHYGPKLTVKVSKKLQRRNQIKT